MKYAKKMCLLMFVLVFALMAGCAGMTVTKTEVKAVTYESVALGLRTAYVYLTEREKNGSLAGEDLLAAKKAYATARDKFLEAGDIMKSGILNPAVADMALYQALLDEAARIAASLSPKK